MSEQIAFAPPIISQDFSYLTKFLSYNIFLTEYAKDKVTAKGRPSGIATTTTVMAIIKYDTISGPAFDHLYDASNSDY